MPEISTHTSRVGCDATEELKAADQMISTHTSRVGCDKFFIEMGSLPQFLLTHPVWDVTTADEIDRLLQEDFYSHIPCGM